jgi:hypothetical protein
MLKRCLLGTLAVHALLSFAPRAWAGEWEFTYTGDTGTASATLYGTLQADGNTIDITAIAAPEFDGHPSPELPILSTLPAYFGLGAPWPTTPEASLDGSNVNFLYCNYAAACDDGFWFDTADYNFSISPAAGFGVSYWSPGGGSDIEPYVQADWSIAAVPEPSTWAMLLLGFAGLGFAAYRRADSLTAAQSSGAPPAGVS